MIVFKRSRGEVTIRYDERALREGPNRFSFRLPVDTLRVEQNFYIYTRGGRMMRGGADPFGAHYRPAGTAAALARDHGAHLLEIALPVPVLHDQSHWNRSIRPKSNLMNATSTKQVTNRMDQPRVRIQRNIHAIGMASSA